MVLPWEKCTVLDCDYISGKCDTLWFPLCECWWPAILSVAWIRPLHQEETPYPTMRTQDRQEAHLPSPFCTVTERGKHRAPTMELAQPLASVSSPTQGCCCSAQPARDEILAALCPRHYFIFSFESSLLLGGQLVST